MENKNKTVKLNSEMYAVVKRPSTQHFGAFTVMEDTELIEEIVYTNNTSTSNVTTTLNQELKDLKLITTIKQEGTFNHEGKEHKLFTTSQQEIDLFVGDRLVYDNRDGYTLASGWIKYDEAIGQFEEARDIVNGELS